MELSHKSEREYITEINRLKEDGNGLALADVILIISNILSLIIIWRLL